MTGQVDGKQLTASLRYVNPISNDHQTWCLVNLEVLTNNWPKLGPQIPVSFACFKITKLSVLFMRKLIRATYWETLELFSLFQWQQAASVSNNWVFLLAWSRLGYWVHLPLSFYKLSAWVFTSWVHADRLSCDDIWRQKLVDTTLSPYC